VGVYYGAPYYWGAWGWPGYYGYYGYPYSSGYPVYSSGYAPQEYVEQPAAPQPAPPPAAAQPSSSWYWCEDPPGYYPHVARCNRPWTAVAPTQQ
jgi:hypothetical protein